MIPLRDENPTSRFPWVTIVLIVVNCLIFWFEWTLSAEQLTQFIKDFAVFPELVRHPTSLFGFLPLVTSMFLHGGIMHLVGNMLYLWIFGNNIEDRFGPVCFIVFYLLSGVFATWSQVYTVHTSGVPMLGASGAISGVLGAYIVLFPRAKILTLLPIVFFWRVVRIDALWYLFFWFMYQSFAGILFLRQHNGAGGIAWFAHIGGFCAGVLFTYLFLLLTGRRKARSRFTDLDLR